MMKEYVVYLAGAKRCNGNLGQGYYRLISCGLWTGAVISIGKSLVRAITGNGILPA